MGATKPVGSVEEYEALESGFMNLAALPDDRLEFLRQQHHRRARNAFASAMMANTVVHVIVEEQNRRAHKCGKPKKNTRGSSSPSLFPIV
jgi:hypothetical protein